jgi:hypothetical protein
MAFLCQRHDGNLLFPHPRPSPATTVFVFGTAARAGEGGRWPDELGVRRVRRLPMRCDPRHRSAGAGSRILTAYKLRFARDLSSIEGDDVGASWTSISAGAWPFRSSVGSDRMGRRRTRRTPS